MRRLTGSALSIGLGIAAIGLLIDLIGCGPAPIVRVPPDRPQAIQSANVLINPDFEDGYYLYPGKNSVRVPNGWNIRWYEDSAPVPPEGNPTDYTFKQPETSVLDPVWPNCCAENYPPRIHHGDHAVESGKQWSPQDVVFYQAVGNIPIGAVVTASAWLHAWVSSCNPTPKNASAEQARSLLSPNSDDGSNCQPDFWPIDSNHMMVGLDPTGGTEPRAATVVWNWDAANPAWWGPYDYYSSTAPALAIAQAHTVTLFLRAVTIQPARYNAAYFDDASFIYRVPAALLTVSADEPQPWPLPSAVTISVQSPIVPASFDAQLLDAAGNDVPIDYVGAIGSDFAYTLRWQTPLLPPGNYTFRLVADEIEGVVQGAYEVTSLSLRAQQDQLLPHGEVTVTEPVWLTLTLHSPITLSEPTATLTDPLGMSLSITLNYSEFLDPSVNYQWSFTTAIAGLHTVEISAMEFTQPFTRTILAATARGYLPLALCNFSAP